jgi:putative glutamine amidotransferase
MERSDAGGERSRNHPVDTVMERSDAGGERSRNHPVDTVRLVAVTGRRLGRTQKWPYAGASAIPRAYLDAVVRAGGQPVVVDPAGDLVPLLDRVDAVVLTGGPDVDPAWYGEEPHEAVYGVDRAADEAEIALTRAALERGTPVLAICRGLQVVNVARGGTLHQHLADVPDSGAHGRPGETGGAHEHEVDVVPGSRLAAVFGTNRVVASCHHHQAVAKLGEGLRVAATAADGTVEGLEADDGPLLAVQWHPEDTAGRDATQQRLFDALVSQTV